MIHAVAFDKRSTASDGAGGTTSDWVEQFACRAEYIHLRGGEGVQSARLEGRHPQIIRVRSSIASRLVATDWQVRDTRTLDEFNIRDIAPSKDRKYIEFLCEKGVAV